MPEEELERFQSELERKTREVWARVTLMEGT